MHTRRTGTCVAIPGVDEHRGRVLRRVQRNSEQEGSGYWDRLLVGAGREYAVSRECIMNFPDINNATCNECIQSD